MIPFPMYLLLSLGWASDHSHDITDVFTWVTEQEGRSKLAVVMTVHPFASTEATFSPNYNYEFSLRRAQIDGIADHTHISYGAAFLISCHLTQDLQHLRCRLAPVGKHCRDCTRVITTSLNDSQGSEEPGVRLFAGLRGDPFFIDTTQAIPRSVPRTDHDAVKHSAPIKGDVLAIALELDVLDLFGEETLYGVSGQISTRATLTEVPRVGRLKK